MNIYKTRQTLKTKSIYDIPLRVVYYARVSSEKEEQKNSIKNQRQHYEEFIGDNPNWVLVRGYIDDGISGIQTEKRESFKEMIKDAKDDKFDLIMTKEISRFARNTLDSIQYTRMLLSHGVCVWFQNDNINTIDDDSEFRLTIMAGVAQDEVRKLSSRVKFGHAQAIKNGVVLGTSNLYGYTKKDGKLIVIPEEAEMVKLIFERYASGNCSTTDIEKELYNRGYRNRKGGKINRNVFRKIIRNPKYKGYYVGGKVKVIDMFTKKQEFLPESEWHMYKDDGSVVPAIVDEELWERANKIINERGQVVKDRQTSFKSVENAFTGKIICAHDGEKYWLKHRYVRGREDAKWGCSKKLREGATSCPTFNIADEDLKQMLILAIKETAGNIDSLIDHYVACYKKILLKASENTDNEDKIKRLKKEIDLIKCKMDKILDYNLNGNISDEEFIRRNNEFGEQLKKKQARLDELEVVPEETVDIEEQLVKIASYLKKCSGLDSENIDKRIVDMLLDKIVVEQTKNEKNEKEATITFLLKGGSSKNMAYHKSVHRSDYKLLTI